MRFLLFLLCFPVFACEQVKITSQLSTNPYSLHALQGVPPFYTGVNGYGFPFVVPQGHYFGVSHVSFSSKDIEKAGHSRNNYFVLYGLMSVPENAPTVAFSEPLVLHEGFTLNAAFINNSDEHQNLTALVVGKLSTDPLFRDCK